MFRNIMIFAVLLENLLHASVTWKVSKNQILINLVVVFHGNFNLNVYQWSSTFFVQSPPYRNFAGKSLSFL